MLVDLRHVHEAGQPLHDFRLAPIALLVLQRHHLDALRQRFVPFRQPLQPLVYGHSYFSSKRSIRCSWISATWTRLANPSMISAWRAAIISTVFVKASCRSVSRSNRSSTVIL